MTSSFGYLLPDPPPNGTGAPSIYFDIVESETHTNASELTAHPVEKGVDISDHVKHDPIEYSMVGWITNAPIEPQTNYGGDLLATTLALIPKPPPTNPITVFFTDLSQAIHDAIFGPKPPLVITSLIFPGPFDKINDTHVALTALERSGGTMTVVTSTVKYKNMVLQKVVYEKTAAGEGTFNLDFKQARIVTTSTVTAPAPAEPRGVPSTAKGSQATKPTDPGSSKSLATKVLDGALGALGR